MRYKKTFTIKTCMNFASLISRFIREESELKNFLYKDVYFKSKNRKLNLHYIFTVNNSLEKYVELEVPYFTHKEVYKDGKFVIDIYLLPEDVINFSKILIPLLWKAFYRKIIYDFETHFLDEI